MIQVDKTDGCQMFLSKDSINAEIVTAKSSEMIDSNPSQYPLIYLRGVHSYKNGVNIKFSRKSVATREC